MARAHAVEQEMLEQAAGSVSGTVRGVHEFADTYLDFHPSHPHIARLWLHRWLGDAVGSADLEALYERPLTNLAVDAVRPEVPAGTDVDYLLWTLVWAMTGFVTYGVPDHGDQPTAWRLASPMPHGHRGGLTAQVVDRFRSHLHLLIDRVLQVHAPAAPTSSA
ncbi:MAG TPA: TetR/AcrR family transcriptional regulator [Spirillospora sp.]|nr:TetR/AcrR family transcriptional regulator [Spirillospora sp.]